ncbi:imelysin family protein, partial [Cognatishimia sp.]|uniref:imelysin family protein n=1 Tax=Cognatishimia sp. TaxID=2211648 RepID=UPI00351944D2
MRAFLAVLFLMPLPLFADGFFDGRDAQTLQKGLTATADRFILPNHQAQAQAAADLVDSLDAYCAAAGTLEDAQSDYADLFLAWQRASIIQIGPVLDGDGPFRFQLWPDPKGFSRRAIRNATRAQDPAVLAAEGFAEQSVALRNLSALERLVFSDLETDSYACRLALTNARYQQEQAQTLVSAWTPGSEFRVDFDSAADGNARYADVDSVARELLAGSVVYLDRLRKFK